MTAFLDTNILTYAYTSCHRQRRARDLLNRGGVIAVQSLNEFALAARRRLSMPWPAIQTALLLIRQQCSNPVPLTLAVHESGMRLAERYRLHIYDSLLLAAALSANCTIFWSEDLHDGLMIDDTLTIQNPFA